LERMGALLQLVESAELSNLSPGHEH